MEKNGIKVERETFERNGKTYFGYFVSGEVRAERSRRASNRPTTAAIPCWTSSLTGAMEADLTVTPPFEMKAEDGRIITGNTYAVTSVDQDTGEVYSCKVKPARESDKTLLQMLLAQ